MGLGSAGGCALGDEGRLALLGAAPARELEHVSDDGLRRRPATGALAAEHDRRAALRADHERVVLGARARERMAGLGVGWEQATCAQVYCAYDIHPILLEEAAARAAATTGLTWYYARPPIIGLDFEVDVRGVEVERCLAG